MCVHTYIHTYKDNIVMVQQQMYFSLFFKKNQTFFLSTKIEFFSILYIKLFNFLSEIIYLQRLFFS